MLRQRLKKTLDKSGSSLSFKKVQRASTAPVFSRNVMPSAVYKVFPPSLFCGATFPERTDSKAKTSLGSTAGSATGKLCAPSTSFNSGASAARRFSDATYASKSVSGPKSQIGAGNYGSPEKSRPAVRIGNGMGTRGWPGGGT